MNKRGESGKKLSYERLLSIVLALVLLCGICSPGSVLNTVAKAEDSETTVTYDLSYYMTELNALQTAAAAGGDKSTLYVQLMLLYSDAEKNLSEADYETFGNAAAPLVDYLMNEEEGYYALNSSASVTAGSSVSIGTLNSASNLSVSSATKDGTDYSDYFSVSRSGNAVTLSADSDLPAGEYEVTISYQSSSGGGGGGGGNSTRTATITVTVTAGDDDDDSGSSGGGNTGGGGSSGETLDIGYYRDDVDVYWDETDGTAGSSTSTITAVTLNSTDVLKADSDLGSGWDGTPLQVGDYFTEATTSNNQQVTLAITPVAGYYVQRIIIACCPASVAPYNCSTWQAGNALDMTLAFTDAGTLYIPVNATAFCHDSNEKESSHQYFILIQTAPLPSPLLVEYDYGIIGNIVGTIGTPFATADGWTEASSANIYDADATEDADGNITVSDINGGVTVSKDGLTMVSGVETEDTQFMYAYDEDTDETKAAVAAKWKHVSNSITDEAIAAAAAAGYRFVGWKATYYTDVTVSENADGSYNNYTYTFSNTYTEATYAQGVDVPLYNHVQLVAQWEPIPMTVTKNVAGLTDEFLTTHDYTLQVQKYTDGQWVDFGDAMTLTVDGNGTATATVTNAVVTPGTYRVVETAGNTDLTSGNTTMYITVTADGELIVTTDDIINGTGGYNLTVNNVYTEEKLPAAIKLNKVWLDADGNEVAYADTAGLPNVTMTVTHGTKTETVTLSYADGWTAYLPIDDFTDTVTVTETVPNGYIQVGGTVVTVITTTDGDEETVGETVTIDGRTYYCTALYTVTNRPDPNAPVTADISVSKQVVGNMADQSEAFTFTATLTGGTMTPGTYTDANGISYTVASDGVTITFSLTHGQTVNISDVPIGAGLTLKETNAGNYTVAFTGATASDTALATATATVFDGLQIVVTNTYEVLVPTGIARDVLPYALLLGLATAGVAVLLRRRRYRYD